MAQQKQRTERIRKETENIKAILDAERGKNVEAIRTAQHIEQEQGKSNVTRIRNEVRFKLCTYSDLPDKEAGLMF